MTETTAGEPRAATMPPTADSELVSAIRHAFHQTGRAWLQHLAVEVECREAVLRGNVPTFYLKQLAQVTVLAVPGIVRLRNEIRVADRTR